MANFKRFVVGYQSGGTTPNITIQQDSTGRFWNGSIFDVSQTINPMSELFPGFYEYETDAAVFDNGLYNIIVYSDASTSTPVVTAYSQTVSGDTLVGFTEASSITSKNAVTALRKDLSGLQSQAIETNTQLGVLADRIDSMTSLLSRRDYNG